MMLNHIKLHFWGCLVGIMAMIFPNISQAFVPTAPQLMYMMMQAIGHPSGSQSSGLVVHHTRFIPAYLPSSGQVSDNPEQYSLVEKLTFVHPDRLKTEIVLPGWNMTDTRGKYATALGTCLNHWNLTPLARMKSLLPSGLTMKPFCLWLFACVNQNTRTKAQKTAPLIFCIRTGKRQEKYGIQCKLP